MLGSPFPLPRLFFFLLCLAVLLAVPYPPAQASEDIPLPEGLSRVLNQDSTPDQIVSAFQGIPYRVDGALNEYGQYSLFADQTKLFNTPGLNCSGLVLGVSRLLLHKNITLDEAVKDRLGDSGPDSPHGEDWDFGWDLIMNISEGFPRALLLPGGKAMDPAESSGFSPRGFDIQHQDTWRELPDRLVPGYLYLVSLTAEGRRKGYGLQHYHVGFIHVDSAGRAWFCQTTSKGRVSNRRDLKSPAGMASFQRSFVGSGATRKMLLILAVTLPADTVPE